MEQLTNDQLISIIHGGPGIVGADDRDLHGAAKTALLKRIQACGSSEKIDSIADMDALAKECKAIEDLFMKTYSAVRFMPIPFATGEPLKKKDPQPGDPYTVSIGNDYTVFKNGNVINWSERDLESLIRCYMKWREENPRDTEGPAFPRFIIERWLKDKK